MEYDYDKRIMSVITCSYKSCKEIVESTGLDYPIVSRRLRQYRKDNIVYFREGIKNNLKGKTPIKYRLKPIEE